MTGIIDVGGGMKCAYSAGLYDYFMDNGIYFDYYLGVSAGSMNLLSYMSGERGRNISMYRESATGDQYLSISNLVHTGAYMHYEKVGEDYFGADGKNAFNYGKFYTSDKQFVVSATDGTDGTTRYFSRRDMWDRASLINILCASCCIPVVSKPIEIDGKPYFDGGLAEPIPFRKAFDDGCDKLVVVLSAPVEQKKDKIPGTAILGNTILREYPKISDVVEDRPVIYNYQMRCLKEYEKKGQVMIFSPEEIQGAFTLVKNEDMVNKLYENGMRDAKKNLSAIRKMILK